MIKLEQLRKVIVEVVPGILDLDFGCEVKGFSEALGRTFILAYGQDSKTGFCTVFPEKWKEMNLERPIYGCSWQLPAKMKIERIGRPIRLADVLLAIETFPKGGETDLSTFGDEMLIGHYEKSGRNGYYSKAYYNLRKDDLSLQSEEFIDFLHSLLVTKE